MPTHVRKSTLHHGPRGSPSGRPHDPFTTLLPNTPSGKRTHAQPAKERSTGSSRASWPAATAALALEVSCVLDDWGLSTAAAVLEALDVLAGTAIPRTPARLTLGLVDGYDDLSVSVAVSGPVRGPGASQ